MSALTRHRARQGDRGFTLVELVMAIAIMGLISTVIAAVITTAFKNNPMAEIRTDTAHTLKGLVTWLPQDVDSTPPTGFDLSPTAASGCASSPDKNGHCRRADVDDGGDARCAVPAQRRPASSDHGAVRGAPVVVAAAA